MTAYNVRIIGRSKTRKLTIKAISADEARRKAGRIAWALSGGSRDISSRIEVTAA